MLTFIRKFKTLPLGQSQAYLLQEYMPNNLIKNALAEIGIYRDVT
jgi:hypothetical protein